MASFYIVTETSNWKNPEDYRFNEKNIVSGIYKTHKEAVSKVDELIDCPLYKPFKEYGTRFNNGNYKIDYPGYLQAEFKIHIYEPGGLYLNDNRCVCCGSIIPEGLQVCGACSNIK